MSSMRVFDIIASISRLAGGLAPAVLESVAAQRRFGVDAHVATLLDAYTDEDGAKYGVPYLAEPAVTPLRYSARLGNGLLHLAPPDIIHDHGMWLYPNYLSLRLSEQCRVPLVVSPHGMLAPWCWEHHHWKKRPIWWLWEHRKMTRAVAVVATAELEARHIRKLGIRTPIAIIPLAINPPALSEAKPSNTPRIGLFLSRMHPVKGLHLLVNAVKILRPSGWKFIIAGPASRHGEEIKNLVRTTGLEQLFEFPGALYGERKWQYYRAADLFILPSLTENFGIVVLEALACETPVLATTGAPWPELPLHGCGWWVEPSVEGIAQGLDEALSSTTATLREMGVRGRQLVESRYTWNVSARSTIELYQWVLGRSPRPAFISDMNDK